MAVKLMSQYSKVESTYVVMLCVCSSFCLSISWLVTPVFDSVPHPPSLSWLFTSCLLDPPSPWPFTLLGALSPSLPLSS